MRHQKAGRRLGRNASHRLAMFRNMTRSLIEHERIVTTLPKAKEVRSFIEKIITLAKKGDLHARRLVIQRLGPVAKATFYDEKHEPTDDNVLKKLFDVIGPRFKDRPGGYTRIIKRAEFRLGDGGKTAYLELLREGETKVRASAPKSKPVAPAPAPTPEPASEPANS